MNTLAIFVVSLVILGLCSADDEKTTRNEEIALSFYKCVACGGDKVLKAYEKCRDLKSGNTKNITEECVAKELPEEVIEGDKRWKYYCENPAMISKVYECFYDYYKTLTDEDKASILKFQECANDVKAKYCK
ncbi:hypothetical protein HNY73_013922 [Argiope bruennichi]|uniref:Uncharacterized protein n=2 Tax=Argiope bruennichi TaxID=94029 RepID=A0A8T0ENP4_ARGBR|nr:hypothetical protein HNY73_013922 [Argiope bruennichi]